MSVQDARTGAPPNVYAALAERARRMSDLALAACLAVGAAGVIAIVGTGSGLWKLAFPLGALAAFGLWGIADRERTTATREDMPARLRDAANAVCWVALAGGTLAGIATALVLLATLLGTIIS